MIVGYARVSTSEQNISTQIELLKENGCEKIFTDIASGVRDDRSGLNEMLSYLRKDDILLVYKTDHFLKRKIMTVGYARVSTVEQNISTQIEMLKENGCEKNFTDIASGVREDRSGLNEMLSYLRKDDIIMVYKTDCIFRSLKNMIDLIEKFNEKGVLFKSITEPAFDTTSANGKFIIQIFGAVAEFERNLISERTKSGLEGARKRKKLLGRPTGSSKESIEKYQYAKHLYYNKNIPIDKACKQAGLSKATFYRIDKQS